MVKDGSRKSRLVMRTAGSLRVILNSPVFVNMTVDQPTEKTVRLSGRDFSDGSMKVYLVTATAKDASILHSALTHRLESLTALDSDDEGSRDKKKKVD